MKSNKAHRVGKARVAASTLDCALCQEVKKVAQLTHHGNLCGLCWSKVVVFGRTYKAGQSNWASWTDAQKNDIKGASTGARRKAVERKSPEA